MGLDAAAPHPTAQLIQLRQTKLLGVLHQDRVDPWDIKAAFDNRGAKHHVGLAGIEGHHRRFQFPLRHLAVGHQQAQARQHLAQLTGHLLNALHPRHHIEHLAAAV